jgi:hypothetical protein
VGPDASGGVAGAGILGEDGDQLFVIDGEAGFREADAGRWGRSL